MRITKHISFFFIENRILYVNKILDETNKYELVTDVFIHTNNDGLTKEAFNDYSNGSLSIIYHDLSNTHPFYLTWKCRELLKEQKQKLIKKNNKNIIFLLNILKKIINITRNIPNNINELNLLYQIPNGSKISVYVYEKPDVNIMEDKTILKGGEFLVKEVEPQSIFTVEEFDEEDWRQLLRMNYWEEQEDGKSFLRVN